MSSDGRERKRQDDDEGVDFSDDDTSQNKIAKIERKKALNKIRCQRYRDKNKKEIDEIVRSQIHKEPTSIDEAEEKIKRHKENDKQNSQRYRDKKRASKLLTLYSDQSLKTVIGSTCGMDLRLHSHEFISKFIDAFRKNPCLWNTLNPEYRNKRSRMKAYNRLLRFARAIEPKITINEIRKKLQSIRASHRKEKRKVEESLKTAINPQDVYVPKLWYYKDLEFLHSESAQTDNSHNFENSSDKSNSDNISVHSITIDEVQIKQQPDDDDDDDSEKSIISNISLNSLDPINETWPPDASSYKISRMEANHSVEQNLPTDDQNHILNYIATKLNTNKDEFDIFGQSIAAELRKMSSKQRIIAKKLMNDVIFHGQLEHLTVDAQIQVNKFYMES